MTRFYKDSLEDPLSERADILRFLVHLFPQGITALDMHVRTPYSLLLQANDPNLDYARRLLLMHAHQHDPTCTLDRDQLRRLNYEARKVALFAFFASTSEWNIFTRIRWASDGDSLMRIIVRFL